MLLHMDINDRIREEAQINRRNALLVRCASNALFGWAQGADPEEVLCSLKNAFQEFENDPDIGLRGVFLSMKGDN